MSVTLSSSPSVEFKPVEARARAVAIVASGPSFNGVRFDLLGPHVHIIAVKGAVEGLRIVHSWITVDANRRCRLQQMDPARRHPGTQYYAAVPADFGLPTALRIWHRATPEPDIHWLERIPGEGLAENPTKIITGNSAYAALGLAYHMGAEKIGLFGVDGNQKGYGLGYGHPRGDLSHLPALFKGSERQLNRRGIEVQNAGSLACWIQRRPLDVIRWLNAA